MNYIKYFIMLQTRSAFLRLPSSSLFHSPLSASPLKHWKRNWIRFFSSEAQKKVQLTPEGEILLRHIEPAINLIKRGESQIMETASTGGQIRIGASDTICRYFLVPYLERFHKAFPNAHIKVTNATSIKCTELLENGQVDLIVANYPNVYLGSLASFRKIRDFHDVFIANQSFAELQGKKLSLKELQRYPIIMLDRKSTTSEYLHNLFLQNQLDLVPEIELSSNDLLIDLARIGLGIAFIPDFCLSQTSDSDSLFIVETKEVLPERELVIAYNEKVPISKAAQEFLSYF